MKLDERYLMHRLRSTSLAAMVGAVVCGGFFLYHQWVNDVIRWDLGAIMGAMAVTKLGAMTYFRFRN